MLTAFKEHLKQLAKNKNDEFLEQIRRRAGLEKRSEYGEALKNLIVVMPDMIKQIQAWSNDSRIPSQEKKLHGFMLTYLYHPLDFIPEARNGFFGYLDDAYLVGTIYYRTIGLIELENHKAAVNNGPSEAHVNEWLKMVRAVIPVESKKIDALLGELINGRFHSFDRLIAQTEAAK